ncbi:RNA polymerase sigma factor [Methylomonas methanica]|uniref:RNA polymerase, sigma-24 subunit, ECF subfamily n=1 Tax=Methylomonas methanica (strain DSM 25384 / MC09) TaxID=857087 RepID=G0A117_METMM|nr:sigma-70 family RNA polymerase sigma factor [Methylomonas methanica]AEG01273.1 RNA polymerase, sigma-24 subunit, ECF subfamily [Methylomonas methanica MC09]
MMSKDSSGLLQQLFSQYAHEVNAFIRSRWPREPDVADIVQETFLKLSQYGETESIQNHRAFLFQTASNLTIDRHRRRNTRERYDDADVEIEQLADFNPSPEQHWQTREQLELFSRWLDELPELRRHAFVLYRIEGCSHQEIATRLGISVRCSERYVMLALQHISKRLDQLDNPGWR